MDETKLDVVQREGEGWSYTIDPTNTPSYLLLKLEGLLDPDITDQYREEVIKLYSRMVANGQGNTPVIADYRAINMSNWDIFRAGKVNMGVFPIHHRVIVLPSQDHSATWIVDGINQFAAMMFRNFKLAGSMEEALKYIEA